MKIFKDLIRNTKIWRTNKEGKKLKIKDLKELLEQFNDNDDVGIEIDEIIYDCYGYDHEWCRKEGHPCLVIAME